MIGKILLYILGVIFIIPGLGSLITGFATPSSYGNIGAGRIGYGIIFLAIGVLIIWAGTKIKTTKSSG